MHLITLYNLEDVFFYLLTKEQYAGLDDDKDLCECMNDLEDEEKPFFTSTKELFDYCQANSIEIVSEDQGVMY